MLRWTLCGWLALLFVVGWLITFRGPLIRMHPPTNEGRSVPSVRVLSNNLPANPSEKINLPRQKIDINRASTEDLAGLPGIGLTLGARIVAYRQEHGPFSSINSVEMVPGIGPRRMETLSERLVLRNDSHEPH